MSERNMTVIVGETEISIVTGGEERTVIGLGADNKTVLIARVDNVHNDMVQSVDDIHLAPFNTAVSMVDGRQNTPVVSASYVPTTNSRESYNVTLIDSATRDECIRLILDSWTRYPMQDAATTAEETHRIAIDLFGTDTPTQVMCVAGVRAALTRGAYDDTHNGAAECRSMIINKVLAA